MTMAILMMKTMALIMKTMTMMMMILVVFRLPGGEEGA
jgi:hypothetical protein